MVDVVVAAEHRGVAEREAEVLRREARFAVRLWVGREAGMWTSQMRDMAMAAQAVVYVPERRVPANAWRAEEAPRGPALIVDDMHGQLGLVRALSLGARGYVGPAEAPEVLRLRVLEVVDGGLALPAEEVTELRQALSVLADEEARGRRLRPIEIWLMQRIALGDTTQEIATRLSRAGLSTTEGAAHSRIRRLREKLDARNEAEVAGRAGNWGLLAGHLDEEPPIAELPGEAPRPADSSRFPERPTAGAGRDSSEVREVSPMGSGEGAHHAAVSRHSPATSAPQVTGR